MILLIVLVIIHWYSSLFFQTFFLHRYASHAQFSMSKSWEKVFYLATWFCQGFSSVSPNTYGTVHRMHHAYADTEKDVHSPKNDKNAINMMIKTDRAFRDAKSEKIHVEERFKKNLPNWQFMEKYAYTPLVRLGWLIIYLMIYLWLIPANASWMWFLFPLHLLMTPLQGVIINWCAHLFGYTNHKVSNTSKNLVPFDLLMMGEGYHNNHHAHPANAKFSEKWYEIDPVYPVIVLLNSLGIIRVKRAASIKGAS